MIDNNNQHQCNCQNHGDLDRTNNECQCQSSHSMTNSEHACGCHHHHADDNQHDGCGCHHDRLEGLDTNLGFSLFFEGEIDAPPEEVWSHLTDNDYLSKWQSDMLMIDCHPGGLLKLTRDGKDHQLMITDVEEGHLLAYLWGKDDMVLTIDPGENDKSLFTFEYWFSDKNEANAEDVVPWIMNLYELEHFIVHDELLNSNDLPKSLTEEVNNLIRSQKAS